MVILYSAFIQGALHRLCITFTHSHTPIHTPMAEQTCSAATLTFEKPGIELETLQEHSMFKDVFSIPEPLPPPTVAHISPCITWIPILTTTISARLNCQSQKHAFRCPYRFDQKHKQIGTHHT